MRTAITYNGLTFSDAQIKSVQMAVDTSLNERTLDVDTMTATVKSSTPLVPFQQNTPVRLLRGGSQYALWYLSEVTRIGPDLYTMRLTSSLGRLAQMAHVGGIYNGATAESVIAEICGVMPYYIQPTLRGVRLYGWLPYAAPAGENGAQTGSAKDNLLRVLFALNATVRDDANGTLRIENLSTATSSQIRANRIYRDNVRIVHEPTVTAVTVLEHQYSSGGELTTLFDGTAVAGQVIVFREPMSDLTATGVTILESNANYAIVSAGTGTLTGRKYVHTTREVTRSVATAPVPNDVRIEDATLVGLTNSAEVANRLADYYAHRTYIEADVMIDFEDAGDVVSILDPYDNVQRSACIEKITSLVVSRTMKGHVSALVDFTPWQATPFEDVREVLTGSGTWTAPGTLPAGTEITVVLIGKGARGEQGGDGQPGNTHQNTNSSDTPFSAPAEQGGAGGIGGAGGEGGKFIRLSLIVEPGDSFSYSALADDTTFGSYSSASGAWTAPGYADPITGDLLAAQGAAGTPGGDGGAGGNATSRYASYGAAGEDVGSYSGGTSGRPQSPGREEINAGSGGGGGAAVGANGGSSPDVPDGVYIVNNPKNHGGNGADALPPAQATGYGTGGAGGNGGGGGGGTGGYYYYLSRYYTPGQSSGGKGSVGGEGALGCVILYYRRPVSE